MASMVVKMSAILNPKLVEKPVMIKKTGRVAEKNMESSILSARTMNAELPTSTSLSASILTLTGSPPADEGVMAAVNMLAMVISKELE